MGGQAAKDRLLTQPGKKHLSLHSPAITAVSCRSVGSSSSCSASWCTCASVTLAIPLPTPAPGSVRPWCQTSAFPGHVLPQRGIAGWCTDTSIPPPCRSRWCRALLGEIWP